MNRKKLVTSCKYHTCGCCAYCPTYKREECSEECSVFPDVCSGIKEYVFIEEETWVRQFAGIT